MRVLHINSGNLYGGIETLLVTLARHRGLCPEMEPHFALCFEGRLSQELREEGVWVHPLGPARVRYPWTIWRTRGRLEEILTRERFDVVIGHGCWSYAIAGPVVRRQHLPLVFYAHGIQERGGWLNRWARQTRPDLVVANSRVTEDSMRAFFPGVPTERIYYPVAAPVVHDRDRVRAEVRQALGTSAEATVIIQVSRLEPWKGHQLLLEALGRLTGVPSWVCWIVGGAQRPEEEAYLAELKKQSTRLGLDGRVRFLGQRTDVPQLLAAADIHCQPNAGPEPFGIAFVEALYAGLPVVTTALGGPLEIIDETCGRLVPAGDVKALAGILHAWISDPKTRQQMAKGGPERARILCDPQTQLMRLFAFLQRGTTRSARPLTAQ